MPSIRLTIDATAVTDWLAGLSRTLPDAVFRVVTDQSTTDGLLGIVEITTSNTSRLIRHFENADEVRSYELLHTGGDELLVKCMLPQSTAYRTLRSSGNLPEYPVHLQDGRFSFTVIGTHEQLSAYTKELAAVEIPYRIESLSQSHDSTDGLTDRQLQFITEAVERGYYTTPRECTLAELAETFGINTSSSSRLLRRAENTIITEYLSAVTPES